MSHPPTIGIFAPSSPAHPEQWRAGLGELSRRGYAVKAPLDPSLLYGGNDFAVSRTFFGAASVEARVRTLHDLACDPEVVVLIAARGGYGCPELLPALNLRILAESGKPIIGGSDVTALLFALYAETGTSSIHGPMVATDFARAKDSAAARENVDELFRIVGGEEREVCLVGEVLRSGSGEGIVLGGNLTMMLSLLGTPWDPDYSGKILVIEEIGEAPYRVHRGLTQLRNAGKLARLSGLVFGRFFECEAKHGATVDAVLRASVEDLLRGSSYPVLFGVPFGHGGRSVPLPIGIRGEIRDGVLTVPLPGAFGVLRGI